MSQTKKASSTPEASKEKQVAEKRRDLLIADMKRSQGVRFYQAKKESNDR